MSTPNLNINTNLPSNIFINNDDRSPLQSPRAKSPTNMCPGAPKKIEIPKTPRVQDDDDDVSKVLFR